MKNIWGKWMFIKWKPSKCLLQSQWLSCQQNKVLHWNIADQCPLHTKPFSFLQIIYSASGSVQFFHGFSHPNLRNDFHAIILHLFICHRRHAIQLIGSQTAHQGEKCQTRHLMKELVILNDGIKNNNNKKKCKKTKNQELNKTDFSLFLNERLSTHSVCHWHQDFVD